MKPKIAKPTQRSKRGRKAGQYLKEHEPTMSQLEHRDKARFGGLSRRGLLLGVYLKRLALLRTVIMERKRDELAGDRDFCWRRLGQQLGMPPDVPPPVSERDDLWRAGFRDGIGRVGVLDWMRLLNPGSVERLVCIILDAVDQRDANALRLVADRLEENIPLDQSAEPTIDALLRHEFHNPNAFDHPVSIDHLQDVMRDAGIKVSDRTVSDHAKAIGIKIRVRGRPREKSGTSS